MGPSNDLLAFITALDEQEACSEQRASSKKKKSKKVNETEDTVESPLVKSISISDFAAVLGEAEVEKRSTKGTEAPLPKTVQSKLERKIAWEQTKNDVTSRWEPFIQRVKETPTLKFPLNPVQVPNMQTVESQMAHFTPQNDFERGLADILVKCGQNNLGDAELPGAEMTTELPESNVNPRLAKKAADAAKERAKKFYQEQKQKHSAKIKSKTYRKHLAKDKARKQLRAKLETMDPSSAMTAHERELGREQAELARIKERFSLKTHKASKWAHELLLNKRGDREFRAGLAAQVKEQQLLREQIMGAAANHSEENENEDEDEVQVDEEEHAELERLKAELGVSDSEAEEAPKVVARRKFGPSNSALISIASDEEKESNQVLKVENRIVPSGSGVMVNQLENDDDNEGSAMKMMQARLNRNQQIASMMFSTKIHESSDSESDNIAGGLEEEFKQEKAKLVQGEAPRTEDITLPGWGSWSGPGVRSSAPGVQVLKHVPGIDPRKRKDAHLDHVILTEKKMKSAVQKYTVERVPMPFENREQYEAHLALPVGPEWNTPTAHKRLTAPKVIAPVGSVIKAPKLPHKN